MFVCVCFALSVHEMCVCMFVCSVRRQKKELQLIDVWLRAGLKNRSFAHKIDGIQLNEFSNDDRRRSFAGESGPEWTHFSFAFKTSSECQEKCR